MRKEIKAIFLPGNGGGSTKQYWFVRLKDKLEKMNIAVITEDFPDPILAREKYWLPFITQLGADENTFLVGHSSGAVAAMRFAEQNKILGSVLVGACYTDLGNSHEVASGYYNHPWLWENIKKNQSWIVQFASFDDPYIPIEEARFIHMQLNSDYYEYSDQGHFMVHEFPKLFEVLKAKLP